MSPLERAVFILGSQVALARAIGVTAQLINKWLKGSLPIPPQRCKQIEAAVDERLAELQATGAPEANLKRVTRHDLCPDLFDAPCAHCPIRPIAAAPPDAVRGGA